MNVAGTMASMSRALDVPITPALGIAGGAAFLAGAGATGYGVAKLVGGANEGDHPVRTSALTGGGMFAGAAGASVAALATGINSPARFLANTALSGIAGALIVGAAASLVQAGGEAYAGKSCPQP